MNAGLDDNGAEWYSDMTLRPEVFSASRADGANWGTGDVSFLYRMDGMREMEAIGGEFPLKYRKTPGALGSENRLGEGRGVRSMNELPEDGMGVPGASPESVEDRCRPAGGVAIKMDLPSFVGIWTCRPDRTVPIALWAL